MTETTTATVTDDTANTAAPEVQADTSLLNTPIPDDAAAADKSADTTQADAGKPEGKEGDTSDADKDKPESEDDKKPEGAPEKYEFVAPEGVTLDPQAVEQFEPIARELNLTNEQAQKLVALQAGLVKNQHEAWAAQRKTWETEVKTDKEIGGEAFGGNVKAAQRALDQFGTPELRAALDSTGMGNHPELVRTFVRIGKAMAEDNFIKGATPSVGKKSAAEVLYGNSTKS